MIKVLWNAEYILVHLYQCPNASFCSQIVSHLKGNSDLATGYLKCSVTTYLCTSDHRNNKVLYRTKIQRVILPARASFCTPHKCSQNHTLEVLLSTNYPCTPCCRMQRMPQQSSQSHGSHLENISFYIVSRGASFNIFLVWWRRWESNPRPQRRKLSLPQLLSLASTITFK